MARAPENGQYMENTLIPSGTPVLIGGAPSRGQPVTLKSWTFRRRGSESRRWGHSSSPLQKACAPGGAVTLNPGLSPEGMTAAGSAPHQSFMVLRTRPHCPTCTACMVPRGRASAAPASPKPPGRRAPAKAAASHDTGGASTRSRAHSLKHAHPYIQECVNALGCTGQRHRHLFAHRLAYRNVQTTRAHRPLHPCRVCTSPTRTRIPMLVCTGHACTGGPHVFLHARATRTHLGQDPHGVTRAYPGTHARVHTDLLTQAGAHTRVHTTRTRTQKPPARTASRKELASPPPPPQSRGVGGVSGEDQTGVRRPGPTHS